MNNKNVTKNKLSERQLIKFQNLIEGVYQCCQDRLQFQSQKFQIPDAELRCLLFFESEKYLTSKGISLKMGVAKSRVTKILSGLQNKNLIKKIKDPEDSRVYLISLTTPGKKILNEIFVFQRKLYETILNQASPEERKKILINLDLLKGCMEVGKELMSE